MLGNEPLEEEIPYDRGDLTQDTQLVFFIYDKLPPRWEGFTGQYLGKDLTLLPTLLNLYNFPKYDESYAWELIPIIDSFVAEDIAVKLKTKTNLGEKT